MKRSTERSLTTHTGSLPRPADLTAMLEALDAGSMHDPSAFEARVRRAARLDPALALNRTADVNHPHGTHAQGENHGFARR